MPWIRGASINTDCVSHIWPPHSSHFVYVCSAGPRRRVNSLHLCVLGLIFFLALCLPDIRFGAPETSPNVGSILFNATMR